MAPNDLKIVVMEDRHGNPIDVPVEYVDSLTVCEAAGMPAELALGRAAMLYSVDGKRPLAIVKQHGIVGPNMEPIWVAIYRPTSSEFIRDIGSPLICVIFLEDTDATSKRLTDLFENTYE